jgi:Leucine Rich repeat
LATLDLGCTKIDDAGAEIMAVELPRTSITKLQLQSSLIGDSGALAILNALTENNCALKWLECGEFSLVSLALLHAIYDLLAARRAFSLLLSHLDKPLDERLIPLVIQAVHSEYIYQREWWAVRYNKTTPAGFILYLLRTVTLNEAKAVEFPISSCS